MIAEIIIQSNVKKLNRIFDYQIPNNLIENIKIGSRVLVPFGNKKSLEEGYVINIKENSEYEVKEIAKVEDERVLVDAQIKLAKWMSNRYFCNISDCLKLMMPPGTTRKNIENRIKEKNVNFVTLKKDTDEIEEDIEQEKIKSEKQIRTLKFIMQNGDVTVSELEIFADTTRAIVNTLCKNDYLEIVEKQVQRNPFQNKNIEKTEKMKLTEEQQIAYDTICDSIEDELYSEFLLYGVTGSGKTEVYMQLIEKVLQENKSSILLVPEISLTPQTVNRFIARFGEEKIAILHSKLSIGERYDEWHKIKNGQAKIIIGARSAIFAPTNNLGLIIIDEEHDSSYKAESSPRYDAKEVSRFLAKENNVPLILGSATPDISSYYRAQKEEIMLLPLTKRANEASMPTIQIVDLREELASGNKSMFSRKLYEEINENLQNKKQSILFLNRRGFSTFVMCRECGYTAKCKNCNINLTYHSSKEKLKCHYCGYEIETMKKCPECGSTQIRYFGTGTQKIESEIKKLFPSATTIRMDVDTVTKKNSHEQILDKFRNESIDILIGTQMVVKGHHFPNVTLVGVIAADSSLNIDDYRANERTFQTLIQVAGRAGREKDKGKVIIQTYNPDNFAIECSKMQNYELFYNTEISLRKQLKYPPFCDIILIGITSNDEEKVIETSRKLHQYLKERLQRENFAIILYPPVPSPVDKLKNKYRWRIIVKCKIDERIIKLINDMQEEYSKMKIKDTKIVVDLNPNSLAQ